MKNLSAVRSCAYLGVGTVLLIISALFQNGLNTPTEMAATYFKSNLYLFILFSVFMGTALYLWRNFRKTIPSLKSDIAWMALTALFVLIAFTVLFVFFGGLGDTLNQDTYSAANYNSVILFLLPAACLVRASFCAVAARRAGGTVYTVAWIGCLVLGSVMLILIFCGLLLHIQAYDVGVAADVNGVNLNV